MRRTLSAVINGVLLIGIISMMFMPISTVMALHPDSTDGSYCHGEPKSAWEHRRVVEDNPLDVNGNGFVCINKGSGNVQDDLLPK